MAESSNNRPPRRGGLFSPTETGIAAFIVVSTVVLYFSGTMTLLQVGQLFATLVGVGVAIASGRTEGAKAASVYNDAAETATDNNLRCQELVATLEKKVENLTKQVDELRNSAETERLHWNQERGELYQTIGRLQKRLEEKDELIRKMQDEALLLSASIAERETIVSELRREKGLLEDELAAARRELETYRKKE